MTQKTRMNDLVAGRPPDWETPVAAEREGINAPTHFGLYEHLLGLAKGKGYRSVVEALAATPAPAPAGGDAWISVDERLPECSRKAGSLGVEVIVYPKPEKGESAAFFGCRITDEPDFYKYGSRVAGVTHWMPLPQAPSAPVSSGVVGEVTKP